MRTLRPYQWVKNLVVLAPMFFHKDLFLSTAAGPALNLVVTIRAVAATAIFCLLSGAVYTINDLVDVEVDRAHPLKKNRPIARGDVPKPFAKIMSVFLVVFSLGTSYLLDPYFAFLALAYFLQNVLYSFKVKHVPFGDVILIALGFVLRVLGGGIVTKTYVSRYLLVCTALLALFLGFGKRRHELKMNAAGKQRPVLKEYTSTSLNIALGITGAATVIVYTAYSLDPMTRVWFQSDWLWLTIPFVLFGILRFLFLVIRNGDREETNESPTQAMLSDAPFVFNLLLWLFVVIAVVYHLRPAVS
ncbi:UbiA prenyltransferase family protein [Pajaroellobacter abortibovis]|uniref:UbiA prenyltransferase family protein n=1 Tax=Pajaroellobacter abortibovis TaxID=1882918 RepID=UPI00156024C3|nr:UbiA prenyltransferase family protein [Pajaroellobacter abortibovis]